MLFFSVMNPYDDDDDDDEDDDDCNRYPAGCKLYLAGSNSYRVGIGYKISDIRSCVALSDVDLPTVRLFLEPKSGYNRVPMTIVSPPYSPTPAIRARQKQCQWMRREELSQRYTGSARASLSILAIVTLRDAIFTLLDAIVTMLVLVTRSPTSVRASPCRT